MRTIDRVVLAGLVISTVVMVIMAGCQTPADNTSGPSSNNDPAAPDPAWAATIATLPQRSVAPPPPMRLAPNLVPPTNTWFAGAVFGDKPQPVFPLPLSVQVQDTGWNLGLPTVKADAKTIFGAHTPALTATLGTARTEVVAYDPLTVTSAFLDAAGKEQGRLLMARGSPYVRFTASTDRTVTVAPPALVDRGGWFAVTVAGTTYGMSTDRGQIAPSGAVRLSAGASLTMWAIPPGGSEATLAQGATVPITGGAVDHASTGDRQTTTLRWRTPNEVPPLVAAQPGQDVAAPAGRCSAGSYTTIQGRMSLCSSSSLTVSTPRIAPADGLDLSRLSAVDRAALAAQILRDVPDALSFSAPDTYGGGKQLGEAATLLNLARGLGDVDSARRLQAGLAEQLRRWADPAGCQQRSSQCFVYDPAVRGIVGLEASYGSDEFNDHHFHYGYFLLAAAVAARDDPALARDIGPVIDLLAADIGSPAAGPHFPKHRAFDPYAGHSWASGFSPFADGNNQESSSEAVNAYNGLALWAQLRGNRPMADQAQWILSSEAASATRLWVNPDFTDPALSKYAHGIVGINWGGKRDYATFFNAAPSAVLGIQILPMPPVGQYLGTDPARVRNNLAEAAPGGPNVLFGDYMLMYLALADPAAARSALARLPDARIDTGNTRSNVMAWIYTRPLH